MQPRLQTPAAMKEGGLSPVLPRSLGTPPTELSTKTSLSAQLRCKFIPWPARSASACQSPEAGIAQHAGLADSAALVCWGSEFVGCRPVVCPDASESTSIYGISYSGAFQSLLTLSLQERVLQIEA